MDGTSEQAEEQLEEEHESSYTTGTDEADEENEPAQVQAGEQREEQMQQRSENTPRRSGRKWKPVTRPGYVSYLTTEQSAEIPDTYEETINSIDCHEWIKVMQEEVTALERTNTWEEVEHSPGEKYSLRNGCIKGKEMLTRERHDIKLD